MSLAGMFSISHKIEINLSSGICSLMQALPSRYNVSDTKDIHMYMCKLVVYWEWDDLIHSASLSEPLAFGRKCICSLSVRMHKESLYPDME